MNEATRTDRFWFSMMMATSAGACKLAVDVIQDPRRPASIAVLLSKVKDEGQRILECQFGLTNVIAWGDLFRERGIPCAETCISVIDDAGTIEVRSPLRSMTDEDEDSTAPVLITLTGVRLGQPGDNEASGSFPIAYAQRAYSPAVGSPVRVRATSS